VPWFDGRNDGFVGGEGETRFCCESDTKFCREVGDVALETDGDRRNWNTAELVGAISCEVGSRIKDSMSSGRAGSCEVGSQTAGFGFSCEVKDGSTRVGLAKVAEGLIGDIPGSRGKAGEKASARGTTGEGPESGGREVDGKSEIGDVERADELPDETMGALV
jgi:hypothetical protein